MQNDLPSAEAVRQRLLALSWQELQVLCRDVGVPFTTVWKVRSGQTSDPRLETVRMIWPKLAAPDPVELTHG